MSERSRRAVETRTASAHRARRRPTTFLRPLASPRRRLAPRSRARSRSTDRRTMGVESIARGDVCARSRRRRIHARLARVARARKFFSRRARSSSVGRSLARGRVRRRERSSLECNQKTPKTPRGGEVYKTSEITSTSAPRAPRVEWDQPRILISRPFCRAWTTPRRTSAFSHSRTSARKCARRSGTFVF